MSYTMWQVTPYPPLVRIKPSEAQVAKPKLYKTLGIWVGPPPKSLSQSLLNYA